VCAGVDQRQKSVWSTAGWLYSLLSLKHASLPLSLPIGYAPSRKTTSNDACQAQRLAMLCCANTEEPCIMTMNRQNLIVLTCGLVACYNILGSQSRILLNEAVLTALCISHTHSCSTHALYTQWCLCIYHYGNSMW
jgi:hypothetical protein